MPPTNPTPHDTDLRSSSWRGVYFDGPSSTQTPDGDEIPHWTVFVGNEEAEPLHTVYNCFSYDLARELATNMARDRKLELVQDATPD